MESRSGISYRKICFQFVIGIILLFLVAFSYHLFADDAKYPGLDYKIKLMHIATHSLFYISGAYYGEGIEFNRNVWDVFQLRVPSGLHGFLEKDNVLSVDIEIPSVWKKDEGTGHKIPGRFFFPANIHENFDNESFTDTFPVLIFYHGGGFVLLQMFREFARDGKFIVLAINYRLAPEHKFPAALMDCYSAVYWALEDSSENYSQYKKYFNKDRVVIAGDSAGATLSMGVSLLARDRGEIKKHKLAMQVLMYPGTYYNQPTESLLNFGDDCYMLPQGKLTALWFHQQYADHKTNHYNLSDQDDYDRAVDTIQPPPKAAAPVDTSNVEFPVITQKYLNLWEAEDLSNLPFTQLVVAEYDPLRDEELLFMEHLKKFDVKTKVTYVENTAHGFYAFFFLNETIQTRQTIIDTIYNDSNFE